MRFMVMWQTKIIIITEIELGDERCEDGATEMGTAAIRAR